jgi:hypothetical protein
MEAAHRAAWQADCDLNGAIPKASREDTWPWKLWKASLAAKHASALQGTSNAFNHAAEATFVNLDQLALERSAQADLIRDIFGNPFQPVAFDPSWRTESVVGLARGMYESRDFGPIPVLADALEDAGCADADVLGHCRGPGPHVRGCWVVDLVLGKA